MKLFNLENPRHVFTFVILVLLLSAIPLTVISSLSTRDQRSQAAGTATLSLVPSSQNVNQNQDFTLEVRENSGTQTVNAAEVRISYDNTKLEYRGADDPNTSGTLFKSEAESTPPGSATGTVIIARGVQQASPPHVVTGNQLFARVTFRARPTAVPGSTTISFLAGSVILHPVDQTTSTDIWNGVTTGGTYTIVDPPPTTSITSPTGGSIIRGTTTVTATATDNNSVSRVEFFIDSSTTPAATDTTSPYTFSWNTTTFTNAVHSVKSRAFDASGSADSSPVSVTVDNQAPTVSITPPTTTPVTGTVTITAVASDNVAISKVEFFVDSTTTVRATDTSSPYTFTWNTTTETNGNHTIFAKAYDTAIPTPGNDTTTSLVVAVDNSAPTVSITSPTAGSAVRGTISVNANASDTGSITKVDFYLDSTTTPTATDTTSPYSWSWNTATTTNGNHNLYAKATDNSGLTTTTSALAVTVDNAAPTVSLTSPGTNIRSTVTLNATASDTHSGVQRVEFLDGTTVLGSDTSSPYSFSWNTTTATNGSHSLTARATDNAGNVTTSTAVTTLVDNLGPTVSITSPGSLIRGTIVLSATASDTHSGVQRVEFLDGTTVLGTDTTSPYGFSWNTTTATNGSHSLTARATDNAGNVTTSTAVTTTVDNQAPSVPTNLRTTNVVYNQVALAWNASTDNVAVARYWVIRNGTQIAQVTGLTYTDNAVSPLTTYSYQITAEDTAGNTSTSTALSVNTPAAPDSTPPSQPTNLVATPTTYYQMNLTWTPSTDNIGVVKYDVFRNGADIADVTSCSTTCSFGDTDLNFNTSYSYHIIAYDANGNASTPSATVTRSTLKVGDLDDDRDIDIFDLSALLTLWNSANITADLNRNGKVDIYDLSILLSNWGQ